MASVSIHTSSAIEKHLRPINILTDLPRIADLIELCFASSMDGDGRSYIQQMRRASGDSSLLRWAGNALEGTSMPLSGFVWEEGGKIIGNASIIPFRQSGRRIYLIANVATHPDHRRRGIARALTQKSIELARKRGSHELWLHVRDDNPGAIDMYKSMGFEIRARRTTWRVNPSATQSGIPTSPLITKRTPSFWPQQQAWLRQLHPPELTWYHNYNENTFKPGIWNWLYRAFVQFDLRHWAVQTEAGLQAVLSYAPSTRHSPLWLAAGTNSAPEAVTGLLVHARTELRHLHRLTLEHPAGQFSKAIEDSGFSLQRTLIWMKTS